MDKYEFSRRIEKLINLLIQCKVIVIIKENNLEIKITNCEDFDELNFLTFKADKYSNRDLILFSNYIITTISTFIDKNISSCYNCYIKGDNKNETN